MIRKPKKAKRVVKNIVKRGNPSFDTASDIISTRITPKNNGVFLIEAFVGGKELLTVKSNFGSYDNAKLAADITKQKLVDELRSSKSKRKNPDDYQLRDSTKNALSKSFALPENNMDAFELGILYGTKNALKNYCGAFDFLKRRAKLKAITKEIANGLDGLARKIEIRGEGIETPIPVIRKVSSKS